MFERYTTPEEFMEKNGYIIDGLWYPRVTKIVSIKAKPALYYFYGEAENFSAGQKITQESAREGTLIHNTIEAILLGQNPEIKPEIEPAIKAFLDFLNKINIQVSPELVERKAISRIHRYAGTVDALALIDGKFGVLDIKTSQAIYRDYNLQTAAYMEALKDEFKNLQTRWILKIDQIQICNICGATRRIKGGREKIKILKTENGNNADEHNHLHQWSELKGDIEIQEFPYWQDDFEAFLGAKKLWEWEHKEWLEKIGYL